MTQPDLVCYMNEYGLVTTNEHTAKLWQANGTVVFVMRPDFEYGDVDLAVPKDWIKAIPIAADRQAKPPVIDPIVGTWSAVIQNWDGIFNHTDDDNCAPDPEGVSFHFDAVKVSGEK